MKIIPVDDVSKITENKSKLEENLNVRIIVKENEVSIDGDPEDEYAAEKIIEALAFGFSLSAVRQIKKDDSIFEILNIKKYTHRTDLERIRARIIGKKGKTLGTLNRLTKCSFALKDNEVGIIGAPEYIKNAQDAIISIIHGSKQANVYNYLEKHHVRSIFDLGLKRKSKVK